MKIYTKIILDCNNKVLEEEYFYYTGSLALAGIHYTFGANKGNKLMEKRAKKEKKLAERKAKREAKQGTKQETEVKETLDTSKPLSLDFITNPDK